MKKEVDYSREQAEQVRADYMSWVPHVIGGNTSLEAFINTKFPPKIDYIGRVWKSINNSFIFFCTDINENGGVVGYGFDKFGGWFDTEDRIFAVKMLLTQATQEEWEAALIKEAKRRYKVGDRIKDLVYSAKTIELRESNGFSATNRLLAMNGVLIMKHGIWATPIKEPTVESVLKSFKEIEKLKKQYFAPTEIEVNGVKYTKKQQ